MPVPPTQSSFQPTDDQLLRFVCSACGVRLVVNHSVAGTHGPCPACGASIVAPPLGMRQDLTKEESSPLASKSRNKSRVGEIDEMLGLPVERIKPASKVGYAPSRNYTAPSKTDVSKSHQKADQVLFFFKTVCIILLVITIIVGVFWGLKNFS